MWLGFVGFLQSVSYIKPILTQEKLFAVGTSGRNATFKLIFLGLGWPWVGGFVGFIIIFICLATQHSLVYRKHPITGGHSNQDQIWLAKKGEYIGFNADRRS